MRGVLVRTGKYRAGDEEAVSPKPTAVLDSVADLPAWLAAHSITGKPRPSP
jgi:ribonucleotide monophosphatase NagD (HAD superfamily)